MTKSWILKGLFLGLAFYIAMLVQKPIGVSTQFSIATGMIERVISPDLVFENKDNKSGYGSTNAYYNSGGGAIAKDIAKPLNYEMIFIVGIAFGAFAASVLMPKERADIIKNSKREGNSPALYLRLFFGGFLLIYGGRLAGGCTSGHMMSGMTQMSLSSFIFTLFLFPVAIFVAKKWGD